MSNECQVIQKISFYLIGEYRNYDAALAWGENMGYRCYKTDHETIIALMRDRKKSVDGIIFSQDFKNGIVQIQIFK